MYEYVHSIYIMGEVFQNASQAHAVFLPLGTMHNTLDSKEALRLIASGYWIITLCCWEPKHQPYPSLSIHCLRISRSTPMAGSVCTMISIQKIKSN